MGRNDSERCDDEVADYEPPCVTMHGALERRTGANAIGAVTDRGFPQGTPIQDLTFSGP